VTAAAEASKTRLSGFITLVFPFLLGVSTGSWPSAAAVLLDPAERGFDPHQRGKDMTSSRIARDIGAPATALVIICGRPPAAKHDRGTGRALGRSRARGDDDELPMIDPSPVRPRGLCTLRVGCLLDLDQGLVRTKQHSATRHSGCGRGCIDLEFRHKARNPIKSQARIFLV
jgi:hypothetical protein